MLSFWNIEIPSLPPTLLDLLEGVPTREHVESEGQE